MASPIDTSMDTVNLTVTTLKAKLAELVTATDPALLATVMGRRILGDDLQSRSLLWASAKADQGIKMASSSLEDDDDLYKAITVFCSERRTETRMRAITDASLEVQHSVLDPVIGKVSDMLRLLSDIETAASRP